MSENTTPFLVYRAAQPTAVINKLSTGLFAYAKQKKGFAPIEYFGFFVAGHDKVMLGGCYGFILYGSVYVDMLYLDEPLRGKGFGTQMMQEAEKIAREKKCAFIAVNTMDWEALGFYQKLGYEVEFKREGYEKNSILYFLRKNLTYAT